MAASGKKTTAKKKAVSSGVPKKGAVKVNIFALA